MSERFSYFGYFIASITIIAILSKLMSVAIAKNEQVSEIPSGVCGTSVECTPQVCDPLFPDGNPNKSLYSCVCENNYCVWKISN